MSTKKANGHVLSKQKGKKKPVHPLNSFQNQFLEKLLAGYWFKGKASDSFANSESLLRGINYILQELYNHTDHFNKQIEVKWDPAIDLLIDLQKWINKTRTAKDVSFFVTHFEDAQSCNNAYIVITNLCSELFF